MRVMLYNQCTYAFSVLWGKLTRVAVEYDVFVLLNTTRCIVCLVIFVHGYIHVCIRCRHSAWDLHVYRHKPAYTHKYTSMTTIRQSWKKKTRHTVFLTKNSIPCMQSYLTMKNCVCYIQKCKKRPFHHYVCTHVCHAKVTCVRSPQTLEPRIHTSTNHRHCTNL